MTGTLLAARPRAYVTAAFAAAGTIAVATVAGIAATNSRPVGSARGCSSHPGWTSGTVTYHRSGRLEVATPTGRHLMIRTTPATRYYRPAPVPITSAAVGQYLLASGDPQADGSFDAGVIGLQQAGCSSAPAHSASVVAGPIAAVHGAVLTVRTGGGMRQVRAGYASSVTADTPIDASEVSPGETVVAATRLDRQADSVYLAAPACPPDSEQG